MWREQAKDSISTYRLKIVTYGTASAFFLATKCLEVLGTELADTHPQASQAAISDFYMDELLTGANSEEEVIVLRDAIDAKFRSANFHLRKYVSNSKKFLDHLPEDMVEKSKKVNMESVTGVTVLGLIWDPETDKFMINLNLP